MAAGSASTTSGTSRSTRDRGPKTFLAWLMDGNVREFAELPSGGDNSYPGFVEQTFGYQQPVGSIKHNLGGAFVETTLKSIVLFVIWIEVGPEYLDLSFPLVERVKHEALFVNIFFNDKRIASLRRQHLFEGCR